MYVVALPPNLGGARVGRHAALENPMRSLRFVSLCVLSAAALAAVGTARAAVALDLTTQGAGGTITSAGVTATYTQVTPQPTGSGYIDPFVRVGMPGGAPGNAIMEAYNTTANVLNNSSDDTFNHEITVGEVGFTTVGAGASAQSVMRFILDINQTSSAGGRLLNLDDVQIFISTVPNQAVTTFDGSGLLQLGSSQLVYRQDNGAGTLDQTGNPATGSADTDRIVTLDYSLNHGSGSGDMLLDIPRGAFDAAFASMGMTTDAARNGAYVYLYSKFGSAPNENTDGFEEWAHTGTGSAICSTPPCTGSGPGVPEPGAMALLLLALAAVRLVRPPRRALAPQAA